MADVLVKNFTGFECGTTTDLQSFTTKAYIVGDGTAKHGDFHLEILKPTASTGGTATIDVTGIVSVSGGSVAAAVRFFFRVQRYPSATHAVAYFGTHAFAMELDTTGHFRARSTSTNVSAFSSAALALNTWYEVTIEALYTDAVAGQDTAAVTVTVVGVESASTTNASPGTGPFTLGHFSLGGGSAYDVSATCHFQYDSVVVVAGCNGEAGNVALLDAKVVSPAVVTGQGAAADFSGSWLNVLDVPFYTVYATEQTSAADEATTTFTHATAAALGLADIAAVKAYVSAKVNTGTPAHAVMLNGTEYACTLGTTLTGYVGIDWTVTDDDFDDVEFGFRNKTGAQTVSVGNAILEVLHNGTPTNLRAGTGGYKQKTVTWTGNGTFQTITGVGFKPQIIMVHATGGASSNGGAVWLAALGGTRSMVLDGSIVPAAVLQVNADGFVLTGHGTVNQDTKLYVGVCIQDGGTHSSGDFVRAGSYIGDGLDDRDITIPGSTFAPEIVLVGGSAFTLRTPDMAGDNSLPLNSSALSANYIQAVTADGFEVGSNAVVNSSTTVRSWIAWRNVSALNAAALDWGTYDGTGSNLEVPTTFTPWFAIAKPATAVAAYVRLVSHPTATVTTFGGSIPSSTAIIAMASITVGTTLSVNGVTGYFLAFGEAADLTPPSTEIEPGLGESFGPIVWIEFGDPNGPLATPWAPVDLADPATYYRGFKEARLLSAGVVQRALSDESGQYETARIRLLVSDADRKVRAAAAANQLYNQRIVQRMIADPDRRLQRVPRTTAVAKIRSYKAEADLKFSLEGEDHFALFTGLGSNDVLVPRRLIGALGDDVPAEHAAKPIPILYGRLKDACSDSGPVVGVTTGDGGSALAQPTALVLTPAATGGKLAAGKTIYVKVTARHAGGESLPTAPSSADVPGTGSASSMCLHERDADARMNPIKLLRIHHGAGQGSLTKYRWLAATAIRYDTGDSKWYETSLTNWGDVHGDEDPNTKALALMQVPDGLPGIERVRLYLFNMYGFHPQDNPHADASIEGDTDPVCRFIECSANGSVLYSRKTGARPDSDYCGDQGSMPFAYGPAGDDGILGTWDDLNLWMGIHGDDDGENYLGAPVGSVAGSATVGGVTGSVACSWSAAAGASGYRVYWTESLDWTGTTYYADVASTSYTITELGGTTANTTRQAAYIVTAIMADGETAPSLEVSITQTGVALPAVLVTWTPKPGAMGYYVYRRQGDQTFGRRWTIATNPAGGEALRTFFTDDFTDAGVTLASPPRPRGVIPALPLGSTVDALGETWLQFLVAGHACKTILALYHGGTIVSDDQYGVDFLAPGQTGYSARFGSAGYRDLNGLRATFVYARNAAGAAAADGSKPITVNVEGIESAADGSGTLLTDLFDQYLHWLRNFVVRDSAGTAWATSGPTWGDAPADVDVIDSDSFAACKAIGFARVPGLGYEGAWAVGLDPANNSTDATAISVNYTQETVRTWIARLNQSGDCYAGFSRKSQFVVRMLNTDTGLMASAPHYTAELGINVGTFAVNDDPGYIENWIRATFRRDWATASFLVSQVHEDPDGQVLIGEVKPYELILWAVRHPAHAYDVGWRRKLRHGLPRRVVSWEADMGALTLDLGDLVLVTHPEGIGADGWTARPCYVIRHEFDADRFVVRLWALDAQEVFYPTIADVSHWPPAADPALEQGADAPARLDPFTPDPVGFDLAVLDAQPLSWHTDPDPEAVAPDVFDDGDTVGDAHTSGP